VMNVVVSVTNRDLGRALMDYGKSIDALDFLVVTGPDVNDGAPPLLL
jgi:hypothetical protein